MKNKTNNRNKANDCKQKVEAPRTRSDKQTEETNKKTSTFKSSMENSDY